MPRVKRRLKRRNDYSAQERHVLLSGVPLDEHSTRFGHPLPHRGGWRIEEIRAAWLSLRNELLLAWQSPEYDRHRQYHAEPFAERLLKSAG